MPDASIPAKWPIAASLIQGTEAGFPVTVHVAKMCLLLVGTPAAAPPSIVDRRRLSGLPHNTTDLVHCVASERGRLGLSSVSKQETIAGRGASL